MSDAGQRDLARVTDRESVDDSANAIRHEYFPAFGRLRDARGEVHVGAVEVALRWDRLAGVDPDADEQRIVRAGAVVGGERHLDLYRAADGLGGSREDDHEAVPAR